MAFRTTRLQWSIWKTQGGHALGIVPLTNTILTFALLLLPVQLRAGTSAPHPHAMLQMILDLRDGIVDHHTPADAVSRAHARVGDAPRVATHDPDVPSFEDANQVGGAVIALASITMLIWFPPRSGERVWSAQPCWSDRVPQPEPPPPRFKPL